MFCSARVSLSPNRASHLSQTSASVVSKWPRSFSNWHEGTWRPVFYHHGQSAVQTSCSDRQPSKIRRMLRRFRNGFLWSIKWPPTTRFTCNMQQRYDEGPSPIQGKFESSSSTVWTSRESSRMQSLAHHPDKMTKTLVLRARAKGWRIGPE